jgi:HEPN domain-containing protein
LISPDKRKAAAKPWFQYALGDLRAAQLLATAPTGLYPQIAYHCQQATEKSMKGFLIYHAVKFQKTHNLVELLGLLTSVDQNLARKLEASAQFLNPFAVTFRYPDAEGEPLTSEQVQRAVTLAKESFDVVTSAIPFDAQWSL